MRHAPAATRHLVVFTRYPVPGRCKTRLIPVLGAEGAARLHRRMTEQTLERARAIADFALTIEVHYAGADDRAMRRWLGSGHQYRPQSTGDLGQRMLTTFEQAASRGSSSTVIIGSDIPQLSAEVISEAFTRLERHPLVLGPSHDGGYYLIGLRHPRRELFRRIPWSTDTVLQRTIERARKAGLGFDLLPALGDVDRPADLHLVRHLLDSK